MTRQRILGSRCVVGLMVALCGGGVSHAGGGQSVQQSGPVPYYRAAPIYPPQYRAAPVYAPQYRVATVPSPRYWVAPVLRPVPWTWQPGPHYYQYPPMPAKWAVRGPQPTYVPYRPAPSWTPPATTTPLTVPSLPAETPAAVASTQPPATTLSQPTVVTQPSAASAATPRYTASFAPTQPTRPSGSYGSSIITFDNQSGQPALVRLVGPTRAEVEVATGGQNSVQRVAAGRYVIYVRYGTPGNYRYSEGNAFDVQGSASTYSHVRITLHTVPAGNYSIHDSSESAFAGAAP